MSTLTPDTILNGEQDYIDAQNLIINHAENTLLIFDQDCKTGDFASLKRAELLRHFLHAKEHATLTIILHDADYLRSGCPRLISLLQHYSHKMTIYITNAHAKVAKDCFMVADNKHSIKRIHIDQARFRFTLDDPIMASGLIDRFNELLEETGATVPASQTGL